MDSILQADAAVVEEVQVRGPGKGFGGFGPGMQGEFNKTNATPNNL